MGVMLVLAGCTTAPKPAGSRIEAPLPAGESARSNGSSATLQAGPGAGAMLQKAEEYARVRRFDLAITTLERALRMEPRNAWIWNRLAATHLEARNRQQAAHLAIKSNALVSEDHPLRALNNQIIARARK
jgi:Flp pilus assembly protein TadD